MIAGLSGKIVALGVTKIFLNTNNIIYEINMSFFAIEVIAKSKNLQIKSERDCLKAVLENETHSEISVLIYEAIKEDSHTLYGFLSTNDLEIFTRLLKVNGIGFKSALAILSTFESEALLQILSTSDVKALTKVSGLGSKGASKVILELSGFSEKLLQKGDKVEINNQLEDIGNALLGLGFKSSDIKKTIESAKNELLSMDLNSAIKMALQIISR